MASLLSYLHALLPHAQIGLNDNIFSHGCDSLTTQRYLARIRDSFQVTLPTQTLFAAPTVSALSRHVRKLILSRAHDEKPSAEVSSPQASASSSDPLVRLEELGSAILHELRSLRELIERPGGIPEPAKRSKHSAVEERRTRHPRVERELTPTQREIQLIEELDSAISSAFARILVLQLPQPLNKETAYRAFCEVSNRHEALRIVMEAGNQRVLPYVDPDIRCVSLPHVSEVSAWVREERQRKFDHGRAPLWRVHLLTTEKDALSLVVITAHALIADSWSLSVQAREFVQLWGALSEGKPCDLPQARQFGELCELESEQRGGPEFRKHRDYWIERIGSQPTALEFPSDEPRRLDTTYEAGCHSIVCDGELRAALMRQGGKKSSTLFQTLLSAYFLLLHRYTGQERLMIGVESSARSRQSENGGEDAESSIGCCSKLVPVVIDFSEPRTVEDILKAVRDETVSAIDHQDYTLSMLAEDLRIPFDPKQPVRIPATISMCSPLQTDACVPRFDLADTSVTHSPFALTLDVRDLVSSLRLAFTYQKAILHTSIERLARWYLRILEAIADDASANLFELQILDEEEQRRILAWGTGEPDRVEGNLSFQVQFETRAAQSDGVIAAIAEKRQITYGELNRDANKLAWRLAELGELERGAAVGILCSRGCDYLTAVIGTLKAGLVCLPLDPGAAPLQARQKLKQAAVGAIWFSEEFREVAEALGIGIRNCRTLCIREVTATGRQENPPVGADADSGAFLIDAPEGRSGLVLIGHRGMLNHLHAKIRTLKMTSNDVVSQNANQCHHISTWQFLAPLLSGANVRVLEEATTQDASKLLVALADTGVTILQARPYILRDLLEIAGAGGDPAHLRCLKILRWLVSTGEVLPADLCRRWISYFPRTKILNAYSSPQYSDAVTHHVVVWPPPPSATRVPIGRPISGSQIYVLDRRRQLAPAGTPGELYVGGCCLAPGNLDEIRGPGGNRVRRTGALVRFRNDGTLEYLGDLRRPLAIGGWRIDPGEVESALRRSPAVLDAAVTLIATGKGDPILAAYVSLRKTPPTSAGILRALVRNLLPQALVPSVVVSVERLPRSGTGDIDWNFLPEPGLEARLGQPTSPSTPIEEELARIWREVLKVGSVGIHDDLFELGGTSLAATQIATRIGATFNFRMPVSAIFRAPTVAGTALYVEQQLASSPSVRWQPVSQTTH